MQSVMQGQGTGASRMPVPDFEITVEPAENYHPNANNRWVWIFSLT
jgi:hypothetical protein